MFTEKHPKWFQKYLDTAGVKNMYPTRFYNALKLMLDVELEKSMEKLKEYVEEVSDKLRQEIGWTYIGHLHMMEGRFRDGETAYREAIGKGMKTQDPNWGLYISLIKQGELDEARKVKAEYQPSANDAGLMLTAMQAGALMMSGDFKQAEKMFADIVLKYESGDLAVHQWMLLGGGYGAQGMHDYAQFAYTMGILSFPIFSNPWNYLAMCYKDQRKEQPAIRTKEMASKLLNLGLSANISVDTPDGIDMTSLRGM